MTISVVQSAPSTTFGSAVTVGSTVFLVLGMYSALPESVTSILLGSTAVAGTTQLVFPQDAGGGSPQGVLVAMLPNVGVSGQTVVNYTTGGSVISAAVVEVAGLGASPTMDQSMVGHGASASIASGTTGATTSVAEFVLAAASSFNGATAAPTEGYWTMGVANALLGIGGHLTVGYDIQSASGQTYSFDQAAGGSVGWAAAVVTIAAGVAPTFDVPPSAPTFMTTFLDVRTEIQLNSVWTDISSFIYQGSTSIGRGHPDESTTASPSTFSATLNNSDGRFSQLNPGGPYYPFLGLNTPIRVSVPEGASYLRLENDSVSYVQGPTSTGFSTGVDVQVDLTPDNWYSPQIIAGQYNITGNERSWVFGVTGSGTLFFGVSSNGVTTTLGYAPFSLSPAGAGGNVQANPHQRMSVRAVYVTSSSTVTFYYGSHCAGWAVIGSAALAGGTPFASTAPVTIGYCPNNDFTQASIDNSETYTGVLGKVHAAVLNTGTGSNVMAPDFTQLTGGVTSFSDGFSATWAVEGTAEVSTRKYRLHAYVAAWPQSWSPNGANALVTLSAGGKLRQQGQSQASVNSAMYRAYNRGVSSSQFLAAYWPMEDLAGSTSIASGAGGAPMLFTGNPMLSTNDSFVGSDSLPVINGAIIVGRVSSANSWGANSIRFLMQVPAAGDANGANVITVSTSGQSAGVPISVTIQYATASNGNLLFFVGPLSSFIFSSGFVATGVNGQLLAVQIDLTSSGGTVTATVSVLQAGSSTPQTLSGTFSGSLGAVQHVIINPQGASTNPTGPGLMTTVVGHLGVYTQYDPITAITGALQAWEDEPAGLRFQRLCEEEGIGFRGMGNMADTVLMGTQTEETVATLLQECADADRGMWLEPKQALGYGYRNRVSIGNQVPWITFDYNQDHLSDTLEPTHDDQVIKNDITVSNQGDGSSAEWVLDDGSPLSVGVVGRYDTSLTINLGNDNQLSDEASWIGHALTVNEPRYTAINTDLANELASFVALYYQILDADIGDRINILNPPVWLPPGVIDQIIQGCNEVLSLKDLTESWNGVPSTPFNVMYLDDPIYGRWDTDGSTLAVADLTGTATSLSVATTSIIVPLWTTVAADFPLNVIMGGEVITVTNISGASSPQTFTVVRSVNGVVKPQVAGTDVRMAVQPTYSL